MRTYVLTLIADRDGDPPSYALSDVIGSRTYTNNRLLRGDISLDLDDVERIAEHFGMTPHELLKRASEPTDTEHAPGPARLRDVVTHSDATASGVPSPEELDVLSRIAAEEINKAKRVKRRRRSGS